MNSLQANTDAEKEEQPLVAKGRTKFEKLIPKVLSASAAAKSRHLASQRRVGDPTHYYDDDIVQEEAREFADRVVVVPVLGDAIRALGGLLRRRTELSPSGFVNAALDALAKDDLSRYDLAKLTKLASIPGNSIQPFMNGGPAGENWNNSPNGFYDWIDNKSKDSILGVELGFKADDYGLEVADHLIAKKKSNPEVYVGLLIDGFVSIIMQKLPRNLTEFEQNTITMLRRMCDAGIDVVVNSSSDPVSADFFAANHIKLWVFDGTSAFFGGIGIESQFRIQEYDEMDLVFGDMVQIFTFLALMLMKCQRSYENVFFDAKRNQIKLEEVKKRFLKSNAKAGNIKMSLRMDVPGYVQDAQKEYIKLLSMEELQEVYILVPYFSDHKVAKALVRTSTKLYNKLYAEKYATLSSSVSESGSGLDAMVNEQLQADKRIHVVFPTKQENAIIEEVSKYYSYYLRNNPIVETRQFVYASSSNIFQMLHAKQMVVTLQDPSKNWTKYVKYGGSYNPAGRAWNMWELNSIEINGDWEQSDEGPNAPQENPIRDYLQNVMKVDVQKYTEPFKWGEVDVKLTPLDKISMYVARHLWF